ncbi:MAG: hypothetical protein KGJ78_03925 [Alphaproteobacteria bacterium]|nr:hypothetical protein [Alphaproteobacteria bacterium]
MLAGGGAAPSRRGWLACTLLFLILLLFYGGLVALWFLDHGLYARLIHWWGVDYVHASYAGYARWPVPFFDIEGVLSWADCSRRGVDVYLHNPCDILNRPANYSPLLVDLPLNWVGARNTVAAGFFLDGLFLLLLPFVLRPKTWMDLAFGAAAGVSHGVLFALERANFDIVIFILVGLAALAPQKGRSRLWLYGTAIGGGLLKFYPFTLLLLAARERLRIFFALAAFTALVLLGFMAHYHREMAEVVTHLPPFTPWYDVFGLSVLPLEAASLLGLPIAVAAGAVVLILAGLAGVSMFLAKRHASALSSGWGGRSQVMLLCGSILIVTCYLLQLNIGYRTVFLLFVVAGVTDLRRGREQSAVGRMLLWTMVLTLVCLWIEAGRVALVDWLHAQDASMRNAAYITFFVLREAVWWCEIALLGGVLLIFGRGSASVLEIEGWLNSRIRERRRFG